MRNLPRQLLFFTIATILTFSGSAWAAVFDPIALNNYGLDLVYKGEIEKGLEQLQRAYFLYPHNELLKKNLAEAYTHVGNRLIEQRRYDEAAEKFDLAQELMPDSPQYAVLRGVAFYFGKRYDAAIYEFDKARKMAGDTVEALYYTGKTYYDMGNLTAAVDVWEEAIQLDPANKLIPQLLEKTRMELVVEKKMDRSYSSRFSITYDADTRSTLAGVILDTLESAYNKICADLDHFPVATTQVILYTKQDYRSITAGPDWSGGSFDGKVRLPVGGATELTPMLRGVLFHEYTHAVVFDLAGNNVPFWLNEGLAEYEGRTQFNTPMASLGRAVNSRSFLPFATLERPFTGMNAQQALLAYQQSYSMVNFMIASYGWPKVKQILLNLGNGLSVSSAVNKALADFGLNYADVEREWQAYMIREFAVSDHHGAGNQ